MRLCIIGAAVLAFALGAAHQAAEATIVIPKNLRELASEAEHVVVAEVLSQHAAHVDGPQSPIYTHTTLAVRSVLKGESVARLVVAEIGGTVGPVSCAAAGMPHYKIGERALVFLKRDALGFLRTHGLTQGKFSISRNRLTGEDIADLAAPGAHVTRGFFERWEVSDAGTIELAELEVKVKSLLTAAKGAKK
jgi:hypothetical protein